MEMAVTAGGKRNYFRALNQFYQLTMGIPSMVTFNGDADGSVTGGNWFWRNVG